MGRWAPMGSTDFTDSTDGVGMNGVHGFRRSRGYARMLQLRCGVGPGICGFERWGRSVKCRRGGCERQRREGQGCFYPGLVPVDGAHRCAATAGAVAVFFGAAIRLGWRAGIVI